MQEKDSRKEYSFLMIFKYKDCSMVAKVTLQVKISKYKWKIYKQERRSLGSSTAL